MSPLLSVVAGSLLLAALSIPMTLTSRASDPFAEHLRSEGVRLRAHFDSVDTELRLASTVHLTSRQREARDTLVEWLREYRDEGRFPLNDRYAGRTVPIFRDSRGVLCAMAYLVDRSGRGDLVDRVATISNTATIAELAGDPDLAAWLDSTGLTVAEAGRIQPWYGGPIVNEDPGVSAGYAITSMVVSGASLATVGLNAFAPSRATGVAGMIAGGAAFIAGVAKPDREGATDDVAMANLVVGTGALTLGLYRLITHEKNERSPSPEPVRPGPEVTVSPLFAPGGDASRIGISLRSTF
jgi:hypothetical protein